MFTSDELLSKVVKIVEHCPSIKRLIYFTNGIFNREIYTDVDNLARPTISATTSVSEALTKTLTDISLHDMVEVERIGRAVMLGQEQQLNKQNNGGDGNGVAGGAAATSSGSVLTPVEGLWMPPLSERPKPSDLAVIMYTSGSTGELRR